MARKNARTPSQGRQEAAPPADRDAAKGFGGADAVVIAAMGAASVAFGVALHLQAGLRTMTSAGMAGALFALLALTHLQKLRIQRLRTSETPEVRREPSLDHEFAGDSALDIASSKLAAAAAALREAEPATRRPASPPEPALQPPSREVDAPDHGWGEASAVDALVRQYAEELDRNAPELPSPKFGKLPKPELGSAPIPRQPLREPASREPAAKPEGPLATVLRQAAEGAIDIHLQPVVSFADRKARMYEVFPKILAPNGKALDQDDYGPEASEMGLSLAIERAALLRCCAIQRRLSERGRARAMIFRLSSAAIRDRAFLERLIDGLRPDPLLADLLIFEVDQREIEQGDGLERDGMELLGNSGFRFSLGSAETLGLEVEELAVRRIGFVRVTPSVLSGEQNPAAVTDLRTGGIETIVTGVVREEDVRVARAFGLVLGQGVLFSEPKPLRADVVDAAPAPVATKPGRRTRAA